MLTKIFIFSKQGATIVDQIVTITPAENYVPKRDTQEVRMNSDGNGRGGAYVNKAQDVVGTVLAKGSALGQDAVNKARRVAPIQSQCKLQVSDETMAAIFAAKKKLNDTGSAVKSSRYVTAGAAWFSGAVSKVARVGQIAGSKTKEKFNLAVSDITSKVTHQNQSISWFCRRQKVC
ncbi:unnamed protein product [Microthlaspi erraticum]|uniref:Senescence domain-containing protein n=1 Tax=Microthlaspi erraticum TaxID=1685480 RepID=A0A6D2IF55_9BRAS|nr:unnamed protein product [Microthlaspi erraticum]